MKNLTLYLENYCLSTDPERLDVDAIHHFLSTQAGWSLHIPRARVARAIQHSLCFGLYHAEEQVGFARVISDFSTIAYLGDVYITEAHQGKGLSKWMMENVMGHPDLQGLRRWILLTGDAHGLYRQYGWTELADPGKWMELHNKDVYAEHPLTDDLY